MSRGIPFVLHPKATDYICVATSPPSTLGLGDFFYSESVAIFGIFSTQSPLLCGQSSKPTRSLPTYHVPIPTSHPCVFKLIFLRDRDDITCRSKRILSLTGVHYITRVNGSGLFRAAAFFKVRTVCLASSASSASVSPSWLDSRIFTVVICRDRVFLSFSWFRKLDIHVNIKSASTRCTRTRTRSRS